MSSLVASRFLGGAPGTEIVLGKLFVIKCFSFHIFNMQRESQYNLKKLWWFLI